MILTTELNYREKKMNEIEFDAFGSIHRKLATLSVFFLVFGDSTIQKEKNHLIALFNYIFFAKVSNLIC